MSMKVKQINYGAPTNQILAIPDHYVAFGATVRKATAAGGIVSNVNGRFIVKAGTIYPANTADAQGVVLNDYDVTDGDAQIAVVRHGFIKASALPVQPSEDAVAALKMIEFVTSANPPA